MTLELLILNRRMKFQLSHLQFYAGTTKFIEKTFCGVLRVCVCLWVERAIHTSIDRWVSVSRLLALLKHQNTSDSITLFEAHVRLMNIQGQITNETFTSTSHTSTWIQRVACYTQIIRISDLNTFVLTFSTCIKPKIDTIDVTESRYKCTGWLTFFQCSKSSEVLPVKYHLPYEAHSCSKHQQSQWKKLHGGIPLFSSNQCHIGDSKCQNRHIFLYMNTGVFLQIHWYFHVIHDFRFKLFCFRSSGSSPNVVVIRIKYVLK